MDVVDFAKHMYRLLEKRELEMAESLSQGNAKDWETYKMMVGEIRGLSFTRTEIRALLEKNADHVEEIISS
jgi:hypothetical protein